MAGTVTKADALGDRLIGKGLRLRRMGRKVRGIGHNLKAMAADGNIDRHELMAMVQLADTLEDELAAALAEESVAIEDAGMDVEDICIDIQYAKADLTHGRQYKPRHLRERDQAYREAKVYRQSLQPGVRREGSEEERQSA